MKSADVITTTAHARNELRRVSCWNLLLVLYVAASN